MKYMRQWTGNTQRCNICTLYNRYRIKYRQHFVTSLPSSSFIWYARINLSGLEFVTAIICCNGNACIAAFFYQSKRKRTSIASHHSAHLLEQKRTNAANEQKSRDTCINTVLRAIHKIIASKSIVKY